MFVIHLTLLSIFSEFLSFFSRQNEKLEAENNHLKWENASLRAERLEIQQLFQKALKEHEEILTLKLTAQHETDCKAYQETIYCLESEVKEANARTIEWQEHYEKEVARFEGILEDLYAAYQKKK